MLDKIRKKIIKATAKLLIVFPHWAAGRRQCLKARGSSGYASKHLLDGVNV